MFRNLFDNPLLLLVIVLLVVVLFGAKRLPDAARSLGRSMRIFKSEVKEMKRDDDARPEGSDSRTTGTSPEALEGRVVHEDHAPRTSPADDPARRDA
ncbi:Sec-independent protein translocase subunit TatA [Aquipuribacter sp. SD81]|uniref:Sec-independent protein translocase subunit TatA n=1 Tax=Aquipuribacter sp. SD81 TaxID=3127703 RepID=UPI003018E63E